MHFWRECAGLRRVNCVSNASNATLDVFFARCGVTGAKTRFAWYQSRVDFVRFFSSSRRKPFVRRALLCVFLSRLLTESLSSSSSSFNDDRLYVRGVILGYKRARTNQYENTSLIKLENVPDKSSTAFYLGKKLCYVYKAHTKKQGTVYRTMWGKVTRAHGTSGVVRAQFKHNLPPSSIGGKIRCMLYPSNI